MREDRLFHDPWAAALAGKEGQEWIEYRSEDSVIAMVLRTRFFDDFLQRITGQHAIRQVMLMAAGLDTRAFRLTWPAQTRLFELYQPAVLQYKEQMLRSAGAQPNRERHTIAVDLIGPWKRNDQRRLTCYSPLDGCLRDFFRPAQRECHTHPRRDHKPCSTQEMDWFTLLIAPR